MSKEEEIHQEHLGELTRSEVEAVVTHLRWVEKFADLMGELFDFEPKDSAADLADRLEWLLTRVKRRTAIHALHVGQCEGVVDETRCEGIVGHDGDCPAPYPIPDEEPEDQ